MSNHTKNLEETLNIKKEEYVQVLKDLIRLDTRVIGHGIDGGYEINGQNYLAEKINKIGGKAELLEVNEEMIQSAIDAYGEGNPGHNYDGRPNLIGIFQGEGGGRSLILNGHIDTMPFGDKSAWGYDPFLGEEKEGQIYGLGSTDMKGGLVASLLAIDLVKSSNLKIKGDIIFESVIDEEGGGNGTLALVQQGIKADGAIVCEPTDLNLQVGHMGFFFYEIKLQGKALHSSRKSEGVNAIHKAIDVINELEKLEHQWLLKYKHPLMPPPTLNVGVIKGGEAGSTVPDECSFKICVHYYPGLEQSKIEGDIKKAVSSVTAGDDWLQENPPEIKKYQEGGAFEIDQDHEIVQILNKNIPPDREITASPAGNDARLLNNITDIPTVVFGPGKPEDAHSINESLSIDDYLKSILIYANFIVDWCGKK